MFVAASVFQLLFILLEVFTISVTLTLLGVTRAEPTPLVPMSFLFVTKPLILLRASERSVCSVKEFVVTDPTKNLAPSTIALPSIFGSALVVDPSDNVLILIASPVVSP